MPLHILKACPFCGKREARVDAVGSNERPFFVVVCGECEAEGPVARSSEAASKAWNTRHAPSKADGHN